MRVSNSSLQLNGFLNIIGSGNKSINKESSGIKNAADKDASSMLESLTKQKENITDMKNELIGKTLENGGELADIKPQIEAYEEQLQLIDEEITQTMSKQAEKMTGKDHTDKLDKATTKQEILQKKNKDMLTLSGSMEQIKILANVKTQMENQANTWSSEIKKDGVKASEIKKQNLADLKCSISDVNQKVMGTIIDTIKSSNQNKDTIVAKEDEAESENTQKDENPEGLQDFKGLTKKYILK